MQSYYSFCGTPLHLILEDEISESYNRFVEAFQAAQEKYKEETGQFWAADQPIELDVEPEDIEAYNAVGEIINLLVKVNKGGLEIGEEDCTTDLLVKL